MSALTTEGLFTSPDGFGVTTATPCQRAMCRILDGRPLGKLAEVPVVVEFVGGPEALAQLPSEHGEMPVETCVLASIKSAKTMIAIARSIRCTQTVDVSGLKHGEVPRVSIVAPRLDLSQVGFQQGLEAVRASRILSKLIVDKPTADSFMLKHPSGRPIEIAFVAGAKAGSTLVSRWSAGVIFDEAPRMNGSDEGVVNLDHARTAVLGRLLPGAPAIYIGSAWAPHGPVYDWVESHWQKPGAPMVILRGTGPMLNPTWWTPKRCADLQKRDPTAYATDVLGLFADPEQGLINPLAQKESTRFWPLERAPESGVTYYGALDPAGGGAEGNATTACVVRIVESEQGEAYQVVAVREWRGLRPEQYLKEAAEFFGGYRVFFAGTDQFAGTALVDIAKAFGLTLEIEPWTATSKLEAFTDAATLIHSGKVELSPDKSFQRDIASVKKRTTQQGVAIILPKTSDGRHCDHAPAFAAALRRARVGRNIGHFDIDEFHHMNAVLSAVFAPTW